MFEVFGRTGPQNLGGPQFRTLQKLTCQFERLWMMFIWRKLPADRPYQIRREPGLAFIFTVRRSALHGICYRNSVCLSVRLSVTLVDCVHTVRPTITISSPYGSPIILVSGDIKFIPKFEGGHPERGR